MIANRKPAGEIEGHEIPFLTFARFRDLLRLPIAGFFAAQFGRANAENLLPSLALAFPAIFAPDVSPDFWDGDVGLKRRIELFRLIVARHQWAAVLDYIKFGSPDPNSTPDRFWGFMSYGDEALAAAPFDEVVAECERLYIGNRPCAGSKVS